MRANARDVAQESTSHRNIERGVDEYQEIYKLPAIEVGSPQGGIGNDVFRGQNFRVVNRRGNGLSVCQRPRVIGKGGCFSDGVVGSFGQPYSQAVGMYVGAIVFIEAQGNGVLKQSGKPCRNRRLPASVNGAYANYEASIVSDCHSAARTAETAR